MQATRCIASSVPTSAFAGFRFPPEVITLAVRWYLRFGLSYRDVEELLAERGIDVDPSSLVHTTRGDLARPDLDSSPLASTGLSRSNALFPRGAVERSVGSAPWAQAAASVGVPSRGRVSLRWPGSASRDGLGQPGRTPSRPRCEELFRRSAAIRACSNPVPVSLSWTELRRDTVECPALSGCASRGPVRLAHCAHTQSRGPNQGDGEAGGEFSRPGSLSCLPAPCRTGVGRFAFLFRPDRNRRLCRPVHGAWIGLIGPGRFQSCRRAPDRSGGSLVVPGERESGKPWARSVCATFDQPAQSITAPQLSHPLIVLPCQPLYDALTVRLSG